MNPTIIISSGEPAGIGPDICLLSVLKAFPARIAVIADAQIMAARARFLNLDVKIKVLDCDADIPRHKPGTVHVSHIDAPHPAVPGKLNPGNATYVLNCINKAVDRCQSGQDTALVTAPVQKSVINDAGILFTGHTEWVAHRTGASHPVMMLANEKLRVCLATTHLPLVQVPASITETLLRQVLEIMHSDLNRLYGFKHPAIGVCGLNPHAGEGGHLGMEETEVIEPAITRMRKMGMNVCGPIAADTAFTRENMTRFDAILAMYHDQGLPVIKHSGFGEIVNITLGLPIIRTSVDHGTALDIAGTGKARHSSLCAAIQLAIDFVIRQENRS